MIEFTRGCTEPASIALNASWVGAHIKNAYNFHLKIDRMTYKNAFRAGIPNANGSIGVKNAFLFGYLIAEPSLGLEIFSRLNEEIIQKAAPLKERLDVEIVESDTLLIHTTAIGENGRAEVTTLNNHTNIVDVVVNGKHILKKPITGNSSINFEEELYRPELWGNLVDELYRDNKLKSLIEEAFFTNRKALLSLGDSFDPIHKVVLARMRGENIRVASCAGSGNKGLVTLLSPLIYGQSSSKERLLKSLILSCLVTSLITSRLGFVSSMCGVSHAAAAGAMAAILYLRNELSLFEKAFQNYIEAVGGVICDGAKKGCAFKASAAVSTALMSMDMARSSIYADPEDGFLGKNFLKTVQNLESYKKAFVHVDRQTINIFKKKA